MDFAKVGRATGIDLDRLRVRLPAPLRRRLGIALRRGLTLGNITDRLADVYQDRVAFRLPVRSRVAGAGEVTFRDVAGSVGRLSTALARAGVRTGDLVVVVPSNGLDFLLTMLAVIRAGGIAVPINPVLKPPEVRTLVRLSGARTIVVDAVTLAGTVGGRSALARVPVERWLSLGRAPGCEDLLAAARRTREIAPPIPVAADTVVAVMYTSGTTGRPKGARLTNDGILSLLAAAALHPTGLPGSVRLAVTALPVAHVMGLATSLGLMLAGVANEAWPRFDAKAVLDSIERDRAEVFVGVPAMFRAMLDAGAEQRNLSSVKAWGSAADVMPRDLARRFQRMGRLAGPIPSLFLEAYGLVELAGIAIAKITPPGPDLMPQRLMGIPIFPFRVKVVDERGRELSRARVGELCVKGPGVLQGYHRDPEATSRVMEGGWFRTGDLARIGPLGTVFFEGRKKEVIKVGGYSVFPVEVEGEIRGHPKIADAAVLGLEDRVKGEVVGAVVVPKKGETLTVAELERWAQGAIASYRRPRHWLVVRSLPRGSTRKVNKRALERMFGRREVRARARPAR